MSLDYTVRPISDRTAFTGAHRRSQFSMRWSGITQLLERELRMLGARNVVLEMDVRETQIRIDGRVRADARPETPAVRLAFGSRHGPLQYATDEFWDWQDNVYAIALSLEALRRVDRYGVSRRGEQYQGWKALPPGSMVVASSSMTIDDAMDTLLAFGANYDPATELTVAEMSRRAKAATHPDRNNGNRADWDDVELATQVLSKAGLL